MSTTINKAVVAVLSGLVTLGATFGLDLGIGEEVIAAIGTAVGAFLVWLIPNKEADTTS